MFRVLEIWKRRFLEAVFTDQPATGQGPSVVLANSITRPPSAPPIIREPGRGSSLVGNPIVRSRSTPPSVDSPTSLRGADFHHSRSDVESTPSHPSSPVSLYSESSSDDSYAGILLVGPPRSVLDADTTARDVPITSLVDESRDDSAVVSHPQVIRMQNYGSHNLLHVGDDNAGNMGIIAGHKSINFLVQHLYHSSQAGERPTSIKLSSMITAVIFIEATQQALDYFFGNGIASSTTEFEKIGSEQELVEEFLGRLIECLKSVLERDDLTIQHALRDYLTNLWSELCLTREQSLAAIGDPIGVETLSRGVTWKVRLFLFVFQMAGYVPSARLVETVKKRIEEVRRNAEAIALRPSTKDLPRARAAYDDYVSSNQIRVSCFEGTRQALLDEVTTWVAKSEVGIFVLFGLAGIGKSTIAQTVAERADNVQLLGASFFFSRHEPERRTAEKFFTTIAFQLCIHDIEYAEAIGNVIRTDPGKGATWKRPLEQLEALILEPLRNLAHRTVVIVIDALDECDEGDGPIILQGLNRLVQCLPSFKVVLTTRPQPHFQSFLDGQTSHKIFHLHNIEDKIVDRDIELYLRHRLSSKEVKVCLPNLRNPWAASEDEIKLLVRAAGRLFIIASTAVLFILDKTSTPAYRMKVLRTVLGRDYAPFNALNNFYTTILRNAVPKDCESDTVDRYQTVVGAIILIQQPLPVSALANLVGVEVNEIIMVLGNLQSVILLGSNDIPVVYHKSFPDYIQDPTRCKDEYIRIDPTFHHTRMAIRCLGLLNRCLKQNIMDLSDPARFMDNRDALDKQGFAENHVQEKIPPESQYACSYFANHIQSADKNVDLAEELDRFVNERFLNWLEALSWIEELDSAHHTLLTVQMYLKLTSSDLLPLVSDGLRFIWKFYDLIKRSALHIYHSALPFTPTETSLYMRYSKQMTFCRVQGGQKMWDGLITTLTTGASATTVSHIAFSQDSALLACFIHKTRGNGFFMTIHDAVAGLPLGRIKGPVFTIANDFSKAASLEDGSITLYNVKGIIPVATIKPPATVVRLALSPDGSRLISGLDGGTVGVWDTEKCELISFGRWEANSGVAFSSNGSRAAFVTCGEVIKLLDGRSGKIVADLQFAGLERLRSTYLWDDGPFAHLAHLTKEQPKLMFSGDGSRLACLAVRLGESGMESVMRVWNSKDGTSSGTAVDVGYTMAISTDGSLIATGFHNILKLWDGNDLALLETPNLDHIEPYFSIWCLAIHKNLLGIGSLDLVALYDINRHTLIARLPFKEPTALVFSPDSSRLASGNVYGQVRLWDVQSITASIVTPQEEPNYLSKLAFSPDCSRLASGHHNGTVKLWNTSNIAQIAAHMGHSMEVTVLEFSIGNGGFASGSRDGIIRLWNGSDGAPGGRLECPGEPIAAALSSSILAVTTNAGIILWDPKTHFVIASLDQQSGHLLALSHHHSLLAAATVTQEDAQSDRSTLMLWDTSKRTLVFAINLGTHAERMRFVPDGSQLAIQGWDHNFYLIDPRDGRRSIVTENQAIRRLSLCPSWHGIPVWKQSYIVGRFSQEEKVVTVLAEGLPVYTWDVGSSMIALGCEDEDILLVKSV